MKNIKVEYREREAEKLAEKEKKRDQDGKNQLVDP